MPEWVNGIKDLTIGVIAVIGLIMVTLQFVQQGKKSTKPNDATSTCAAHLSPYIADNIKVNTELVTLLREQHEQAKADSEKQQEALQGLVIAINQLVMITSETLSQVKDLKRG